MIRQVCRFCRWLITDPGIYCTKRNREYTEQYAKSANNCGDFELNVIDAFGESIQRPRVEIDEIGRAHV